MMMTLGTLERLELTYEQPTPEGPKRFVKPVLHLNAASHSGLVSRLVTQTTPSGVTE
jgi:hypothetical protein